MKIKFLLAAGLFCVGAFAQSAHPDFSGTWKLNTAKSTEDGPRDRVYTMEVQQTPKTITITTKAAGVTNVLDGTFPLDGKPRIAKVNNVYRTTRVFWENGTLLFEITDRSGKKITTPAVMGIREAWTASPDGKVMTKFRQSATVASPTTKGKVADQKYVFDKQ